MPSMEVRAQPKPKSFLSVECEAFMSAWAYVSAYVSVSIRGWQLAGTALSALQTLECIFTSFVCVQTICFFVNRFEF